MSFFNLYFSIIINEQVEATTQFKGDDVTDESEHQDQSCSIPFQSVDKTNAVSSEEVITSTEKDGNDVSNHETIAEDLLNADQCDNVGNNSDEISDKNLVSGSTASSQLMETEANSVVVSETNVEFQESSTNGTKNVCTKDLEQMNLEKSNAENDLTEGKQLQEEKNKYNCLDHMVKNQSKRVFLLQQLNESNDAFGIPRLIVFNNWNSSLKTGKEILHWVLETIKFFFEPSALQKILLSVQGFCYF